ncbi:MAG: CIA30 family protein [Chlorobiaceae bacterium]|jgi:NADH dehydrogenase [ubiquinone] 1 alpha subcomplex assembly factor 1|nr:CIA30 family protein [Chlorobiaceae bacterium]NTW62902.1 CIA30 family protein [Chlorobiaceae bacterium]
MRAEPEKIICDFASPVCLDWYSVDDDVMGGMSGSYFRRNADNTGSFCGVLSVENSGGFASVRTFLVHRDFLDCTGIRLRVKGDGRQYSFRIRNDEKFDGIVYKQDFVTIKDEWTDVTLPFSGFKPAFRGRTLDDGTTLNRSNIVQIGILVSKKQTGAFCLVIDRISAVRSIEGFQSEGVC